jgi:hypothetical protein
MTPLVICAYCKAEIPPVLGNAVDVGLGLMHRPCAAAYEIDESNRMYVLLQRAQKAAWTRHERQKAKGIVDPDYRDKRFKAATVCLTPGCGGEPYRESNGRTKGRCRACRSEMERQRRAAAGGKPGLRARRQNAVMA